MEVPENHEPCPMVGCQFHFAWHISALSWILQFRALLYSYINFSDGDGVVVLVMCSIQELLHLWYCSKETDDTVALILCSIQELFRTIYTMRPNATIIAADFSFLPEVQIQGRNAPLVASKVLYSAPPVYHCTPLLYYCTAVSLYPYS